MKQTKEDCEKEGKLKFRKRVGHSKLDIYGDLYQSMTVSIETCRLVLFHPMTKPVTSFPVVSKDSYLKKTWNG